jgi:hypothetical protein
MKGREAMKLAILPSGFLLLLPHAADSRASVLDTVSYETQRGFSREVCREVDFFAGSEIDTQAAGRAGISYFKNYAAMWLSPEEVAPVEFRGLAWVGEASKGSIALFGPWRGEDQGGTEWRFRDGMLCLTW